MDGRPPREYILLCAVAFLTILSGSVINPLLSIFAKRIGAIGVAIGLVVSAYWTSRIFMEIPSGLLSSKLGYFKLMAAGLTLTILGNILCHFVRNPYQLMAGRAMIGLGAPLFYAVAMTFVVDLFTAERRGSAMGFFQGVEFIGTILGSSISGYVVSLLGFRKTFLLSSLIGGVALLLLSTSGIRRRRRMEEARHIPLSAILEILGNRNIAVASSSIFAEFVMSVGVLYTILPIYMNESIGLSLTVIGLILSARSLGFVSAMFTLGPISDKMGRKPVLLFGLAATGVLIVLLRYAYHPILMAATIFLIGLSTGAIWIVSPVIASESVREELRGAAIGAYRTFFDLGSIVGPIIMSTLSEEFNMALCFYIASAFLLVNLPLALMMKEMKATSSAS